MPWEIKIEPLEKKTLEKSKEAQEYPNNVLQAHNRTTGARKEGSGGSGELCNGRDHGSEPRK